MRRLGSVLPIAGALILLATSAFAQDAPRRARVARVAVTPSASTEAKAELAVPRVPTVEEISAKIADPTLRRAAHQARGALVRLAESDASDAATLDRLYRELEQAFLTLHETAQQTTGYETGTFKCKGDMSECQDDCKSQGKKLCGCFATFLACLILP